MSAHKTPLLLSTLLLLITTAHPATNHLVTTTADSGIGSLRQTIAQANPGDTINFDLSLQDQTIAITLPTFPGLTYHLETSTNPNFTNPTATPSQTATNHTLTLPLPNTPTHYYRAIRE